jgi:phosphate transport system permease protein
MQQEALRARSGVAGGAARAAAIPIADRLRVNRRRNRVEGVIQTLLLICGAISILTTVGIVVVLFEETIGFFRQVSLLEFLTNPRWIPRLGNFGVLPLLWGTMLTTIIAMIVALPVGLGSAIYLSEYAAPRVRGVLKPALELLAGVPTVVYGYFALTFMTPLLRGLFGPETVNIYNAASAGLVMGIMIIPLVSSFSEDALAAVPSALR